MMTPDDDPYAAPPPAEAPAEHFGHGTLGAQEPTAPAKRPSYLFLAVVSFISLALDLGSKRWAEKALAVGDVPAPRTIIKGVFGFVLAKNKGGAWGLLQGSSEKVRIPFFVIVSVLAILFIV